MAYELIVTEAAHSDLDEALDYIVHRLSNPTAAVSLLDQVEACYGQLRNFPMLYEACRDPRLRDLGYRKVVIGHYILVYHRWRRSGRSTFSVFSMAAETMKS